MLEYFEALDRLVNNEPIQVPKGTEITNDSVALEAGKGKGAIKKSRPVFQKLIDAIASAAVEQERRKVPSPKERIAVLKSEKEEFRRLYCESLNREVLLLERLANLEEELSKYRSGKITNIRQAISGREQE